MDDIFAYFGALASIWIVAGIFIASLFYPNYSHSKQFCSELGAADSPTQKLSPIINNYPLGALFTLFGWYIISNGNGDAWNSIIGAMIVIHGIGTWIAGYFPMDKDPYTTSPTTSCKIHSWAGLVMLLSLLLAPAVSALIATYPLWFRLFSAGCIIGTVLFTYTLVKTFKAKSNPGLHQRLSYGFQILWLFIYSLVVAS